MLPRSDLYFADLHFHSLYSDNRDRASIEEMLLEGQKRGISIFGAGDHNHNLDIEKWQKLKRDTVRLQSNYPDLLVMANCEITFLLGHLLVLVPGKITGTIREGYDLLYHDRKRIKILAHPNPTTDEWHERFAPDAAGIEVINGAVLRQAREKQLTAATILDIPMVRLYARYLSLDYAVAAIGNSDAHSLAEMGTGLTGMHLPAPLKVKDVLTAIRRRETFATTDPGIRLSWSVDDNTLSWHVEWNPGNPIIPKQHTIEIYRGESRVRTARKSGNMQIRTDGLYWLCAFNDAAYAVSSPIRRRTAGRVSLPERERVPSELLRKPLRDLAFQHLRHSPRLDAASTERRGSVTIDLLSRGNEPLIVDAKDKPVPYTVEEPARERVVIDKSCTSPCFDEFFLWLRRNEIHEYGFLELDYHLEKELFRLQARIVPAIMVLIAEFGSWHRGAVEHIRKLITPTTRFQLDVRTLFRSTLSLHLAEHCFPLRVQESEDAVKSMLVWFEDYPAGRIQDLKLPDLSMGEKIYQIFVSP